MNAQSADAGHDDAGHDIDDDDITSDDDSDDDDIASDNDDLGGYAESMAEIESILASLADDNVDIDTLASQVKRASRLIAHCEKRLRATEISLQTILAQHTADNIADNAAEAEA